jgi:membrane-associated phospholipid phosphatase
MMCVESQAGAHCGPVVGALPGGGQLGRNRATVTAKWVKSAAFGFPGGHVMASVVFFGVLIYVLWTATRRVRGRSALTSFAVVLVVGIAYSRLYVNAHWLTDVLGELEGADYLACSLAWIERGRMSEQ